MKKTKELFNFEDTQVVNSANLSNFRQTGLPGQLTWQGALNAELYSKCLTDIQVVSSNQFIIPDKVTFHLTNLWESQLKTVCQTSF